ncbi:MAG: DUF4403 family protein [Candidatus Dadabacteria bacterium]
MKILNVIFIFLIGFLFPKNASTQTSSPIGDIPLTESQIDIPISINLNPIYRLAESKTSTVFTSPGYPQGWVQADCSTRYKYHFRRSPLQMSLNGSRLDLSFTGYYQIEGSTRACVNGVVVSPWSPACRCGFKEPERRILVGFSSSFNLSSNYILRTTITPNAPKAIDKCEVCFWGQDVTNSVISGVKAELDASRKMMLDSFGVINIRPYIQQAWYLLNQTYSLPNVGYFNLHPKRLRMENINGKNDLLNVNIGISANPVVSFIKPQNSASPLPDLTTAGNKPGFNVFLEAALKYDSLTTIMNGYLVNKRFDVTDGFIRKYIIIQNVSVSGNDLGNLSILMDFKGSFDGSVVFTGKPVYNASKQLIEVENLDYDLKTRNFLLKAAKWLFSNKISSELKKYSSFSLSNYYSTAGKALNSWINREWVKGIKGIGGVQEIQVISLTALPEHLLVRSNCVGNLSIQINSIDLNFQH